MHGDAHVETLERVTFGGRLSGYFTAHPKKDPDTGAAALAIRNACRSCEEAWQRSAEFYTASSAHMSAAKHLQYLCLVVS